MSVTVHVPCSFTAIGHFSLIVSAQWQPNRYQIFTSFEMALLISVASIFGYFSSIRTNKTDQHAQCKAAADAPARPYFQLTLHTHFPYSDSAHWITFEVRSSVIVWIQFYLNAKYFCTFYLLTNYMRFSVLLKCVNFTYRISWTRVSIIIVIVVVVDVVHAFLLSLVWSFVIWECRGFYHSFHFVPHRLGVRMCAHCNSQKKERNAPK